jgi:ABC-2 type transport system permease protein
VQVVIRLVKNEVIKVLHQRKLLFLFILIFLMVLAPILFTYISRFKVHDGQTYPLFFLGMITSLVVPIFISIITADMVTEEYVSGTLSTTLIHPVSRLKLLTAKVITLYLVILLALTYTMLLSYGLGSLSFGWGEAFLDRGIIYSSREGIIITLGSYLISSLPLLSFALFVVLLAHLFLSASAVVGISISLMILFSIVGLLVSEIQPYLLTTYFTHLGEMILFSPNREGTLRAITVILLYGIISFALSAFIFKRRDLHY